MTYTVNHYLATKHIGIWCNGNTTDSGPVILGSSPSIPTKQSLFFTNRLFSYMEGSVKKCTASRKVLKSPLLEAVHHIMLSVFTSLQSRL